MSGAHIVVHILLLDVRDSVAQKSLETPDMIPPQEEELPIFIVVNNG